MHKSLGPKRPRLTPEIIRAIADAYEVVPEKDNSTLCSLIRLWRSSDPNRSSSPEWASLASTTKKTWGSALDQIEDKWGEVPLAVFNDPRMIAKIYDWRDSRRDTPRAADIGITVLRALLKFGIIRGFLTLNVAADVPRIYRDADRAEIIWLPVDLERFAAVANQAVNDAVQLACHTGLRLADLADLRWHEVSEKVIIRTASKSSRGKRRKAVVPVTQGLKNLLATLRLRPRHAGVDTVLVTTDGKSWSSDGLGKRVGEFTVKAGIVHSDGRKKHLHDCRGTFATHLMLAGANDQEIARTLAWAPDRVANIRLMYVDQARTVVALAERLTANAVNRPVN